VAGEVGGSKKVIAGAKPLPENWLERNVTGTRGKIDLNCIARFSKGDMMGGTSCDWEGGHIKRVPGRMGASMRLSLWGKERAFKDVEGGEEKV